MPDGITASRPADVTDAALLLKIAQRERQALEQFYDRYSARVGGWAMLVQPDRERAEEITVETFWYVWKHADRMQSATANIETWLTHIVAWAAASQGVTAPDRNADPSPARTRWNSDEPKRLGLPLN